VYIWGSRPASALLINSCSHPDVEETSPYYPYSEEIGVEYVSRALLAALESADPPRIGNIIVKSAYFAAKIISNTSQIPSL
jgi:hypothetical protein